MYRRSPSPLHRCRRREYLTAHSRCRFKPRFCSLHAPNGVPGFQEHPSGLVKPAGSARISRSAFIGYRRRKRKGRRNEQTDEREKEEDRRNAKRLFARVVVRLQNISCLRFPPVASSHTTAASPRRVAPTRNWVKIRRYNHLTDQSMQ